jgi:hypothetical protein
MGDTPPQSKLSLLCLVPRSLRQRLASTRSWLNHSSISPSRKRRAQPMPVRIREFFSFVGHITHLRWRRPTSLLTAIIYEPTSGASPTPSRRNSLSSLVLRVPARGRAHHCQPGLDEAGHAAGAADEPTGKGTDGERSQVSTSGPDRSKVEGAATTPSCWSCSGCLYAWRR